MRQPSLSRVNLALVAGIAIFVGAMYGLLSTPIDAHAATVTPGVCRAVMIFDRSQSVGPVGIQTMKEQVKRVFEPTGIYDPKIQLAFWSFSSGGAGTFDYNSPGFEYVSSKGPMDTGFASQLNLMASGGGTNYEQGFGYNNGVRNPKLGDIPDKADIIVFMTDGKPNQPFAPYTDGSPPNVAIGRTTAQKYLNAGKVVIGGLVGTNIDPATLAEVINGDPNNRNNLFTVSSNYNDLSAKLKQEIGTSCAALTPPPCQYNPSLPADDPKCKPPAAPYSLVPSATTNNSVISSNESATFQYKVNNASATITSDNAGWSIKQIVVDKTQSADPIIHLGTDTNPYVDNSTCPSLVNMVGGASKSTCQDNIASGSKQFPPGSTTLSDLEAGAASRLVVEDKWPVGTKVCFVLTIAKPTEQDAPTNRSSRAACVVIGKRPTVQVWGSDLSVGGLMPGDAEGANPLAAKINTGVTIKGDPINRVFGSWVEYGVFAPGTITGLASASGLESGYPTTSGEVQSLWSKLTFANDNEFGQFADARTMPDTASALLAGGQTATDITTDAFDAGAVNSGIYQKQAGNLTLATSVLGKGKSVIINVPNGTVTISGNLNYSDEALSSLNDIPRLVIIARNINIVASVANVDAWLIARNSPNSTGGGIINTCSDGPVQLTVNDCNQILRINGAVMARQILLRRTAGSEAGAGSGQPGEIFNLRADAYLSALARRTDTTVPITTYSVELPPRF